MPIVACARCGTMFKSHGKKGRRYCSADCRGASTRCVGCGTEFPTGPATNNPRRWCSESCRVKSYYASNPATKTRHNQQAVKRQRELRAEKNPLQPCLTCGVPKHRNGKRHCSRNAECRRAGRADRAKCSSCDQPAQGRGMCSTHYQEWWREQNPEMQKVRNLRGRAVRKAVVAAAFVESVSPLRVYEMDGWRCHLCGKKISKRFRGTHPLAPSVDHVIPLSKGGLHVYENCRAAHFGCNSAKCNRGGGEQLILIAPRSA